MCAPTARRQREKGFFRNDQGRVRHEPDGRCVHRHRPEPQVLRVSLKSVASLPFACLTQERCILSVYVSHSSVLCFFLYVTGVDDTDIQMEQTSQELLDSVLKKISSWSDTDMMPLDSKDSKPDAPFPAVEIIPCAWLSVYAWLCERESVYKAVCSSHVCVYSCACGLACRHVHKPRRSFDNSVSQCVLGQCRRTRSWTFAKRSCQTYRRQM